LANLIYELGEETDSRRIAAGIVRARSKGRIVRTGELAALIEQIKPRRGAKRHPATKVFQALRIAVNQELEALREGMEAILSRMQKGGRFGVITFHSLEDRMVKRRFKEGSVEWLDRPDWPAPKRNPKFELRLVTSKAVEPSEDEMNKNPRSRSAKLRVVEKL